MKSTRMSSPKSVGLHGVIAARDVIGRFRMVAPVLLLCVAAFVVSAQPRGAKFAISTQQQSAGVWDATPYVKRDFDRASVNAAAIRGTDDSPNITRALADMVQAGCTTLYLPAGCYRINTPIALPAGVPALNFRIVGAGTYPLPFLNDPISSKATLLAATNGNAIFDWDGALDCTWESLELIGYTNLSKNNPNAPPWLVRLQATGAGLHGLSLGGINSHNTFRHCGFAYAAEAVRYGVAGQNGNDQVLFDDCSFFCMPVGYHQANDQSLDGIMYRCSAANVGTIAWIEKGGHFAVDGMMLLYSCGYGLPAPVYGDPAYAAGSGKYWCFNPRRGGINAETITLSGVRCDNNTGQLITCAGRHEVAIVNLDMTGAAGFAAPLFAIQSHTTLRFLGGYVYGPAGGTAAGGPRGGTANVPLGISGAGCWQTFCGTTFEHLPAPTTVLNAGRASDAVDCRYDNNGAWASAPSSL